MRVKGIVLVVFGMSLSFAVILGTLGAFSSASTTRKARHPRILKTQQQGRRLVADARGRQAHTAAGVPDAKVERPLTAQKVDSPAAPPLTTIGRIESLKSALTSPSEHLSNVHTDLERQIAALKRNRDLMLDDLATELSRMTPEMAADEIRLLDNESVKLTLSRLAPVQRKAIRRALDSTQAGVLDRNQRSLAAK